MTNLEKVDHIIGQIYAQMAKPGSLSITSKELRLRANRRREYASQVKLVGGTINPDYEGGYDRG